MCPRFFDTLVRQHDRNANQAEHRERITDHLLAQIAAMVANTGFRGWEETRQVSEFLPTYPAEASTKRFRRPSDKQLSANLQRTMERAMRYQEAQGKHGLG